MELYLHQDGEQVGPYTEEQIVSMVSSGELRRDDIIWHEGLAEWRPINTVVGLPAPLAPPVRAGARSGGRKLLRGGFKLFMVILWVIILVALWLGVMNLTFLKDKRDPRQLVLPSEEPHYFDKQIGRVITFEDNAGESYDNSEDALEYILESSNQIKEKLLALEKTKELYNRCMELSQQIRVSEREISEMQKRYLPKWPPLVEAQELDRILKQQFISELQQVFRLSEDEKEFWDSNSGNLDNPESGNRINAEIQFVSTRASVLAREIDAEQRIFDNLTTQLKEGNFSK